MEQKNNGAVGTVQKYPRGAPLYKEEKKRSKAPWILIVILLLALLGSYAGLCAYAGSLDAFYPNRRINGVAVGGLTAQEAQTKLENTLLSQNVILCEEVSGSILAAVTLEELGYTEESFAGDAAWWLEDQKNTAFIWKGWEFFNIATGRWPGGANWREFDSKTMDRTVDNIVSQLTCHPVHGSYEVGESAVRITKAKDGRALNAAALKTALMAVHEYSDAGYQVQVRYESIPANQLDVETVYEAIRGEMRNASYDISSGTILPEDMGADFDLSEARALLDAALPGEEVLIPARIEFPQVTAEELKEVLFRDVLGECRTLVTGTTARRTNVRLSAEKINGIVMNAGDVFSYNASVGKRTEEAGFQPAPAYVQGETVDEVGGGICQTSSTLYYACLKANLEITERYAHRYVPAYIDWGMDATVSWGGPDYKFTNSTLYPIKIETEYKGGYLTVRLLGTNIDGTYAKMTNEVLSRTDWETEYVEDLTLAPGAEVEKTSPYTGYKVKSYRHVYDKDGNLISSALEDTSNYKVRNKVILRGPAVPAPEENAPVVEIIPLPEEPPTEPPVEQPVELPVEIILGDA